MSIITAHSNIDLNMRSINPEQTTVNIVIDEWCDDSPGDLRTVLILE